MPLPFTSLGAVTAPAVGAERDLEDALSRHTMFVSVSGGPSTVQISLQGSHDGVNWRSLGGGYSGAAGGIYTVSTDVMRYIRAELLTLTGGTTPTVTATIASQ